MDEKQCFCQCACFQRQDVQLLFFFWLGGANLNTRATLHVYDCCRVSKLSPSYNNFPWIFFVRKKKKTFIKIENVGYKLGYPNLTKPQEQGVDFVYNKSSILYIPTKSCITETSIYIYICLLGYLLKNVNKSPSTGNVFCHCMQIFLQ